MTDPRMPFPPPVPTPELAGVEDQPVVRPYAMTFGRTRPARGSFELTSLIQATRSASTLAASQSPEHMAILRMSQRAVSVAEVAGQLRLPLGVVRVFLGDLLHLDLIGVRQPQPAQDQLSDETLEALIAGLRAL